MARVMPSFTSDENNQISQDSQEGDEEGDEEFVLHTQPQPQPPVPPNTADDKPKKTRKGRVRYGSRRLIARFPIFADADKNTYDGDAEVYGKIVQVANKNNSNSKLTLRTASLRLEKCEAKSLFFCL